MPQIFHPPQPESEPCIVNKNGEDGTRPTELGTARNHLTHPPTVHAHVLERKPGEVYVHYAHTDKRLDEWVPETTVRVTSTSTNGHTPAPGVADTTTNGAPKPDGAQTNGTHHKKRKRSASVDGAEGADGAEPRSASRGVKMSEEEYDIEHHKQITAKRNFDKVIFGRWQIRTWCVATWTLRGHLLINRWCRYFSPYPLTETEIDEHGTASTPGPSHAHSHAGSSISAGRIPGVARSSLRSHGRTSDLLAGGLGRNHGTGEKSTLWVCDKCFKYMAEGQSWELHVVSAVFISRTVLRRLIAAMLSRGSALSSTHQARRCIKGVLISSGRSTEPRRRYVSFDVHET